MGGKESGEKNTEKTIMPALLVASFLGFAPPDMKVVYRFFGAMVGLFFFLLLVRAVGRIREKKIEKESAWKTFRNVAKARGLKREQVQVLAHIAGEAGLQRPAQIVGSISLFDRSVDQVQAKSALAENQLMHLEAIRKKLVSTAEIHDEKTDRRQLERVPCAMGVNLGHVSRDELEQELRNRGGMDEETVKVKLKELGTAEESIHGQVTSISAGGIAVMVGEGLEGVVGDYVGLTGGASGQGGVDLSGLWGEIRTVRKLEEQAAQVLHLRFLGYETEKKREVIQLVYRTLEEKKGPPSSGPPKSGKKSVRKKAPKAPKKGSGERDAGKGPGKKKEEEN